MPRALDVPSVIAGEAVSGSLEDRWNDMVNIASVISNRAQMLGVTPQEVIANTDEFNAYNRALPPGVNQDIVDLAQQAMDYVEQNGPVNNATFYATPAAANNLPNGLNYETETTGHQFFSDPQTRAIGTANGYVTPNEYAYAQNPANVPAPYAPSDLTNQSLLSAFSATPTFKDDPFSAVLSDSAPPSGWADMAAANPISSPMGSVVAQGDLASNPALAAMTRAVPSYNLPAAADLGTPPGFIASATVPAGIQPSDPTSVSGFQDMAAAGPMGGEIASPESRMGISDPGFDIGRMTAIGPSVTSIDASRFASDPKTSRIGMTQTLSDTARMDPMAGLIDPATNTQSFMPDPAATGILSAEHQAVQQQAQTALDRALAERQALSIPATGILAANQPLEAQASVPSLASAYTAPATITPAEQAINAVAPATTTPGLLSPTSIATASAPLSFTPSAGILAGQPVQQNAFVSSFPTAVANNTIEPATVNDVVAAPTLDTMQVSDQPSIASIDGPVNTPAVTQQTQTAVSTATTPSAVNRTAPATSENKGLLGGMMNKGTIGGGVLGALAAGPLGGVIGAMIGNQIAKGGLSGLSPTSMVSPSTQIGGGIANIGGIYGGAYSPGTYAVASNGATVGAQPGGWTSYTNSYGVTNMISPTGQQSSYFGSTPMTPDTDQDAEADATI